MTFNPAREKCAAPWGWSALGVPLLAIILLFCCQRTDEGSEQASSPAVAMKEPLAEGTESEKLWRGRPLPAGARLEIHESFLADRAREYDPADGGGEAKLLEGETVKAGERGRWVFQYRAGPLGMAKGGALYFQVSPFWGWSEPQVSHPDFAGYTTVDCSNKEVELRSTAESQWLLIVTVIQGAIQAGDTITLTYGAGPAKAVADRYAEAQEFFYFWLDGDGNGSRRLLATDVEISILPRPASDYVLTVPSTARPGETFALTLAFLDLFANAAPDFVGEVKFMAPDGIQIQESAQITVEDQGCRRIDVVAREPGIYVIEAQFEDSSRFSNPVLVSKLAPKVFWADLHGHSTLSDGSGTPEEYYRYARDVAGLDIAVLTDHDHYGMRKIDEVPELWQHLKDVTNRFHEPHRFVTLVGYEWTNWIYGHRHVLYFGDDGELLSCIDLATESPEGLWQALDGQDALTVAHHPGGGPVPVDWSFVPPPHIEPVVEIVSVHGSSESLRSPLCIRNPHPGSFVRDALARGYRLGFIGSGDSHDGHPGLAHRGGPTGGLAAIVAEELTRPAILAALRNRSVYATSGERIYVEFKLGETSMGQVHTLNEDKTTPYHLLVIGTAPLEAIDLVKNGELYFRLEIDQKGDVQHEFLDPDLARGDVAYLRARQKGGAMAWSSPIWVE